MDRQQRRTQLQILKHNQTVNDTLTQRLSTLLESLKAHADDPRSRSRPAEVAFQALMEVSPQNKDEDTPPPMPEGVRVHDGAQPTYSDMMVSILDAVVKTIDDKKVDDEVRYDTFTEEVGVHLQKANDAQARIANNIEELEKEDAAKKIVGDGYQFGSLDISSIVRAPSTRASTRPSTPKPLLEMLNPGYETDRTGLTSEAPSGDEDSDDEEGPDASPTARDFAQIHPSEYRVSCEFVKSHPEILVESETDGLLIEAFHIAAETSTNDSRVWQYVHQALLLQYCRMVGQSGITMFFNSITTPGHKSRDLFDKEVNEKFNRIKQFVIEDEKQRAAEEEYDAANEKIQIQPLEPGTIIQIRIPEVEGGDDKQARAIFDNFAPDMKKALESGSLDEVNKVLGGMRISEAEDVIELLGEAGCLGIKDEIIDTTPEEDKKKAVATSDVPVQETACH